MMLTIHTLFNDPNIVNAVIQRVLKTRKDTIYWQQYLGFRRTTTRVFKDYIGQVTGVMAGSINSRYGEKPIRERRNIGSGYGEIAYLGDRYQISIDRLSDLQDLIDKYNAAKPEDLLDALKELQEKCGVANLKMSDYGISPDEFHKMAHNAKTAMAGLFMADRMPMSGRQILSSSAQISWKAGA